MGKERQESGHPAEIELFMRYSIALGLMENFRDAFKPGTEYPIGYSVVRDSAEDETLFITRENIQDRSIEQLIIIGPMIKFIEKRKGKYSRIFLNSFAAIEKAERFMEKISPMVFPKEEEWEPKLRGKRGEDDPDGQD